MNPTVRQQNELARTIKQFAFEESPMFQQNHVQEMNIKRQFIFFDQPELPEDFEDLPQKWREIYQGERTQIELGFRAVRVRQEDGKPIYCFEASIYAARSITTGELSSGLSQDAWDGLSMEFGSGDIDFDAEDSSDTATQLRNDRREEIIDVLRDGGIECETFQSEMLSFSTIESTIESSYEKGYLINDVAYDVRNSHNLSETDENYSEYVQTADGGLWITHRNQGRDGVIDVEDEISVGEVFGQIVAKLGEDQISIDLLPYADKRAEMLYVIECLRKKVLLPRTKHESAE